MKIMTILEKIDVFINRIMPFLIILLLIYLIMLEATNPHYH